MRLIQFDQKAVLYLQIRKALLEDSHVFHLSNPINDAGELHDLLRTKYLEHMQPMKTSRVKVFVIRA